jgi:hypothetical protein
MASVKYQTAIEHFEFVDPDKVPALKNFAKTCSASTIVIDAARGAKISEGAAKGGEGRGRTYAPITENRKRLLADILLKHSDEKNEEIAKKLGKAIAKDNLEKRKGDLREKLFDGLRDKHPDMSVKDFERLLEEAIAQEIQMPADKVCQTGRTPGKLRLERLVRDWRKELSQSVNKARRKSGGQG